MLPDQHTNSHGETRKAVATEAAKSPQAEEVCILSREMSHRVDAVCRHYEKLDTFEGATKAHTVVKIWPKRAKLARSLTG